MRASDGGIEHVDILNEKGDLSKRNLIDLNYNREGFIVRGHHATSSYYILAVKNDSVFEIRNIENLLQFLNGIDTMEEALLISQINEFNIDRCFVEGGAFRKVNDRYEFQLMRSNSPNTSIIALNWYALIQYLVYVEKDGTLTSKSCGIYCEKKKECVDCK